METRKIIFRLTLVLLSAGLLLNSCKKDSTAPGTDKSLTSQQIVQVQNSDAEDAIADKTTEDIDNKLDELESNNYSVASAKSSLASLTDTVVITVDHPDTTFFPKVVTLTFYNYKDSSAFENITKNGQITVTINSAYPYSRKLVSRAFSFNNFAVTTDSTTFIINGTRLVNRESASFKYNGIQTLRLSVTDEITAALNFAMVTTGSTDTLRFTRNVNKVRVAEYHFRNVIYRPLDHLHFMYRYVASSDTITYTGTVTGIDEKGDAYSKTINDPLKVTLYKGSFVISSGSVTYTAGTDSYDISFEADPVHKHFTLVTVKNNTTGTSTSFDRRFGRMFRRWW